MKVATVFVYINKTISFEIEARVRIISSEVFGDERNGQWLEKGIIVGGSHNGLSVQRIAYRDSAADWDNYHAVEGLK